MRHLFIFFAICFSSTVALAQDSNKTNSSSKLIDYRLLPIFKDAKLTADEEQKVIVIVEDNIAAYKTLRANTSLNEEDLEAEYRQIRITYNAKLKDALGEEKLKLFRNAQKARTKKLPVVERSKSDQLKIYKNAGLTKEEVQKVTLIKDEKIKRFKKLDADTSLSVEDEETKANEIRDIYKASLKEVLGEAKLKALGLAEKAFIEEQSKKGYLLNTRF